MVKSQEKGRIFDPADRKNRFTTGIHDMRRAGRAVGGTGRRRCKRKRMPSLPKRKSGRNGMDAKGADVSAGPQRRASFCLIRECISKELSVPYGAGTPRKGENRLIPAAVRRTSPPMRRIPREERYSPAGRCFPAKRSFPVRRNSPGRWSLTAGRAWDQP